MHCFKSQSNLCCRPALPD